MASSSFGQYHDQTTSFAMRDVRGVKDMGQQMGYRSLL